MCLCVNFMPAMSAMSAMSSMCSMCSMCNRNDTPWNVFVFTVLLFSSLKYNRNGEKLDSRQDKTSCKLFNILHAYYTTTRIQFVSVGRILVWSIYLVFSRHFSCFRVQLIFKISAFFQLWFFLATQSSLKWFWITIFMRRFLLVYSVRYLLCGYVNIGNLNSKQSMKIIV